MPVYFASVAEDDAMLRLFGELRILFLLEQSSLRWNGLKWFDL